jgi:hypothetical protein
VSSPPIRALGFGGMTTGREIGFPERDLPGDFGNLTVKELALENLPEKVQLRYNPSIAETMDIIMEPQEAGEGKAIRLIKTKIDGEEDREYYIDFRYGTEAGSRFVVSLRDGENLRQLGEVYSLELIIPGDGRLYSSGPVNGAFLERRAFVVEENAVCEIEHPIMYREEGTIARKDAILYADERMTEVIEKITAGGKLTILLRQGDIYLVRTSSGQMGWVRSTGGIDFHLK